MPHYIHVDFQLEYSLVRIHEKIWGRYDSLLKAIKKTNPQYQPTYASQYDKLPQYPGVNGTPFKIPISNKEGKTYGGFEPADLP